jgi:hypothetical protein
MLGFRRWGVRRDKRPRCRLAKSRPIFYVNSRYEWCRIKYRYCLSSIRCVFPLGESPVTQSRALTRSSAKRATRR